MRKLSYSNKKTLPKELASSVHCLIVRNCFMTFSLINSLYKNLKKLFLLRANYDRKFFHQNRIRVKQNFTKLFTYSLPWEIKQLNIVRIKFTEMKFADILFLRGSLNICSTLKERQEDSESSYYGEIFLIKCWQVKLCLPTSLTQSMFKVQMTKLFISIFTLNVSASKASLALYWSQCEQIGRFLNVFCDKISISFWPKYFVTIGDFKNITFKLLPDVATSLSTFGKIGLLFCQHLEKLGYFFSNIWSFWIVTRGMKHLSKALQIVFLN